MPISKSSVKTHQTQIVRTGGAGRRLAVTEVLLLPPRIDHSASCREGQGRSGPAPLDVVHPPVGISESSRPKSAARHGTIAVITREPIVSLEVHDLFAVARDLCALAAILGAMGGYRRADELVGQAADLLVHRAQLVGSALKAPESARRRSEHWVLPWMN